MDFNYLTTIILLPAVGSVLIAFIPGLSERWIRRISAVLTLASFVLAIVIFAGFDRAAGGIQFEEKALWIQAIGAHYHLGVDGLRISGLKRKP